jgi:autotransporter-associated beta strand protein
MKKLFPVIYVFSCLIAAHSFAGSATWNLNPTSDDWNTATNWMPATVPNGANAIATFGVSNTTGVSISHQTKVAGIVYNPAASAFTITLPSPLLLTFSGAGITNNSGVTQTFVETTNIFEGMYPTIKFTGSSTAGTATNYIIQGGPDADYDGGAMYFQDMSSAGDAFFTLEGGLGTGATLYFQDSSTAANATFYIPASMGEGPGGVISFDPTTSAANGTFVADGGIIFVGGSIGQASFTINGSVDGRDGAYGEFYGIGGGDSTFITNGGSASGADGGNTWIFGGFDPGNSSIVANGGINGGDGGEVIFLDVSTAVNANVEVYGNGNCNISGHDSPGISFGSLKGDGLVSLGTNTLTVGTTNLSTDYSGVIQDDGALTKIGTGTVTLSGASTYKGGTTVSAGTLLVKNTTGSATGTEAVQVSGGILGGKGIIAGAVTIGTGSASGGSLQPGKGASTATTLTIQKTLTFKSDGTYSWKLNTKKAKADQVIANGVAIETGAQFDLNAVGNKKLTTGKVFTAISSTATTPITGTFANLADGSSVTLGVNKLQVSYSGGDGNDLTLTVVP